MLNQSSGQNNLGTTKRKNEGFTTQHQQQQDLQVRNQRPQAGQQSHIISMYPHCNFQTSALQNTFVQQQQQQQQQLIQQQQQNSITIYPCATGHSTSQNPSPYVRDPQMTQNNLLEIKQQQQQHQNTVVINPNWNNNSLGPDSCTVVNVKEKLREKIIQQQQQQQQQQEVRQQDHCIVYFYPSTNNETSNANSPNVKNREEEPSRGIGLQVHQIHQEKDALKEGINLLDTENDKPSMKNELQQKEKKKEEEDGKPLNLKVMRESSRSTELNSKFQIERSTIQDEQIQVQGSVMIQQVVEDKGTECSTANKLSDIFDQPFNLTIKKTTD